MEKAFKDKETIINQIRKRMDEKNESTYKDWQYYSLEVDVCDITIDDKIYRVPAYIGKIVAKIIENPKKNNEMVALGNLSVRAYLIRKLKFHKERFVSLDDWGKTMLLKENPKLLADIEEDLSPQVKDKIMELKSGKSKNEIIALPVSNVIPLWGGING